jgi:Icc protein
MRPDHSVVFVIPGDLHLTEPDLANHRTAQWMVDEINSFVHPDFVQFIGDNVQNARAEEFELFRDLCAQLTVPYSVLVGDHDACGDVTVPTFQNLFHATYGASSIRGVRFLKLNSMEFLPHGYSDQQLDWIEQELATAEQHRTPVVIFQHHYPFKVWESFSGPGTDRWRKLMLSHPVIAIFTGHTHYGQIANNGTLPIVTTRSIGDPEGGPAGYSLVWLRQDDLALTYRTVNDTGPIVLVTHPRERLLAIDGRHVVRTTDEIRVVTWSVHEVLNVRARVDQSAELCLKQVDIRTWTHELDVTSLLKGEHILEVQAKDKSGAEACQRHRFLVDPTGRYAAAPATEPIVLGTAFC